MKNISENNCHGLNKHFSFHQKTKTHFKADPYLLVSLVDNKIVFDLKKSNKSVCFIRDAAKQGNCSNKSFRKRHNTNPIKPSDKNEIEIKLSFNVRFYSIRVHTKEEIAKL